MPDDMLEDAITVAKKALEEHDFEEEGVEVSFIFWLNSPFQFIYRSLKLSRNTWMMFGNLTGTCSSESLSDATLSTRKTASFISNLKRAKFLS